MQKGRRDFTQRLIGYAVEGGVLARCSDHAGSIYRTDADIKDAYDVVRQAWQIGEISSDFESAKSQLDRILDKAPNCCSQESCWTKQD